MGFLDWFLIGWVAVSVIATPLVGRLVASRLDDPPADEGIVPEWRPAAHD